jgi:primosomal protein N''
MNAGKANMSYSNELDTLSQNFAAICREFDTFSKKSRQDNLSARLVYEQNINVLQRCKQQVESSLAHLKTAENDEMSRYYCESVKKSLAAFKESLKNAQMKVSSARPMPPFFF